MTEEGRTPQAFSELSDKKKKKKSLFGRCLLTNSFILTQVCVFRFIIGSYFSGPQEFFPGILDSSSQSVIAVA